MSFTTTFWEDMIMLKKMQNANDFFLIFFLLFVFGLGCGAPLNIAASTDSLGVETGDQGAVCHREAWVMVPEDWSSYSVAVAAPARGFQAKVSCPGDSEAEPIAEGGIQCVEGGAVVLDVNGFGVVVTDGSTRYLGIGAQTECGSSQQVELERVGTQDSSPAFSTLRVSEPISTIDSLLGPCAENDNRCDELGENDECLCRYPVEPADFGSAEGVVGDSLLEAIGNQDLQDIPQGFDQSRYQDLPRILQGFDQSRYPVDSGSAEGVVGDSLLDATGNQGIPRIFQGFEQNAPEIAAICWTGTCIALGNTISRDCSASILNNKFLLTAAHCVDSVYLDDTGTEVVNLGQITIRRTPSGGTDPIRVYRGPASVYRHPQYTEDEDHPDHTRFDLAVVMTAEPMSAWYNARYYASLDWPWFDTEYCFGYGDSSDFNSSRCRRARANSFIWDWNDLITLWWPISPTPAFAVDGDSGGACMFPKSNRWLSTVVIGTGGPNNMQGPKIAREFINFVRTEAPRELSGSPLNCPVFSAGGTPYWRCQSD